MGNNAHGDGHDYLFHKRHKCLSSLPPFLFFWLEACAFFGIVAISVFRTNRANFTILVKIITNEAIAIFFFNKKMLIARFFCKCIWKSWIMEGHWKISPRSFLIKLYATRLPIARFATNEILASPVCQSRKETTCTALLRAAFTIHNHLSFSVFN